MLVWKCLIGIFICVTSEYLLRQQVCVWSVWLQISLSIIKYPNTFLLDSPKKDWFEVSVKCIFRSNLSKLELLNSYQTAMVCALQTFKVQKFTHLTHIFDNFSEPNVLTCSYRLWKDIKYSQNLHTKKEEKKEIEGASPWRFTTLSVPCRNSFRRLHP